MRGLEITILLICIVLAIPLTAVMLPPSFNSGNGIPTGANDLSFTNAFNWSKLDNYKLNKNPSIVDQVSYFFNFAVLAIEGMATILFSIISSVPALLSIFGISGVMAGVLMSIIAVVIIIAWLQIIKGDDWSGRR